MRDRIVGRSFHDGCIYDVASMTAQSDEHDKKFARNGRKNNVNPNMPP